MGVATGTRSQVWGKEHGRKHLKSLKRRHIYYKSELYFDDDNGKVPLPTASVLERLSLLATVPPSCVNCESKRVGILMQAVRLAITIRLFLSFDEKGSNASDMTRKEQMHVLRKKRSDLSDVITSVRLIVMSIQMDKISNRFNKHGNQGLARIIMASKRKD